MRMRWCFCFCCSAGVLATTAALTETAAAQDRIDRITQSAAEVQRTESYGQPYERGQGFRDQGSQYGQPPMQGQFQRGYASQGQWDQSGDRFGQQTMQGDWREDDAPAGLGVVLRETGDQGVQVVDVHRESPAADAGIRPGDQIVAINGRRVDSVRDLQSRVMQQDPGDRMEVVAVRNGREQTFEARLQTRSEALNRQQQARYQGGSSQRFGQAGSQDRQIQSRLASLERQLQQLLREVRTLQYAVGSQTTQMDYAPQPPRQAQRQDQQNWQDGGQQWDQQGQRPFSDQYFDDRRQSQDRRNQDQFDF